MTFTRLDKGPFFRLVDALGGLQALPFLPRDIDVDLQVASIARALNEGDFWTVWEVDFFCVRYLQMHPALVYGDAWWDADAPEFHSRDERNAAVLEQLDAGRGVVKVARMFGLDQDTVSKLKRSRGRSGPPHRPQHTPERVEVVRSLKRELAAGMSRTLLQAKYGMTKSAIAKIARGEQWAWVSLDGAA